jgi:hypothetical protein
MMAAVERIDTWQRVGYPTDLKEDRSRPAPM